MRKSTKYRWVKSERRAEKNRETSRKSDKNSLRHFLTLPKWHILMDLYICMSLDSYGFAFVCKSSLSKLENFYYFILFPMDYLRFTFDLLRSASLLASKFSPTWFQPTKANFYTFYFCSNKLSPKRKDLFSMSRFNQRQLHQLEILSLKAITGARNPLDSNLEPSLIRLRNYVIF